MPTASIRYITNKAVDYRQSNSRRARYVPARKTLAMWNTAAIAIIMALPLGGVSAADLGGSVVGAFQIADADQANWHGGGHRGGNGGRDGGGGGSGGSVIIGFPGVPGTDAPYPPSPYPYPSTGPARPPTRPGRPPESSNSTANEPQAWPVWYFCDQPNGYYPYVKVCAHAWQKLPVLPPPPSSGAPVAFGLWEYCDDPAGYFPYIAQCRHDWTAVVASNPVPGDDPEGVPLIANWFYCEDAKDYLPYVGSYPHPWRTTPSVPPPNIHSTIVTKTAPAPR
jgi:hypothetical protein